MSDQAHVFTAETARTCHLISAAVKDCFNYHLEKWLEDESAMYPPESLKSTMDFSALADFGAKLVMKHTGKKIVFIKTSVPLAAWMPETMMFLVPPDKIQEWKAAILGSVANTAQELIDEFSEIEKEVEEERAEDVANAEDAGDIGDTEDAPEVPEPVATPEVTDA